MAPVTTVVRNATTAAIDHANRTTLRMLRQGRGLGRERGRFDRESDNNAGVRVLLLAVFIGLSQLMMCVIAALDCYVVPRLDTTQSLCFANVGHMCGVWCVCVSVSVCCARACGCSQSCIRETPP